MIGNRDMSGRRQIARTGKTEPGPWALPGPWSELFVEGVGIRPFLEVDAAGMFEAVEESRKELGAWMVWCSPEYSLADSKEFSTARSVESKAGKVESLVIFDWVDGSFLGSVGLSDFK